VLTQEQADLTLQRIALTSLLHYPEITIDDPTYQLQDEVDWCVESLDPVDREALHDLVTRTILNPTEPRTRLFSRLMELAPDGAS
jgi:hypothetical protein